MPLAEYIINKVYIEDGENGLYYHDGQGSYINADQEAGDNSYRYVGANPNNFVCFGSDVTPCPADNLYQIIGVFDGQIKLIKKMGFYNVTWGGVPNEEELVSGIKDNSEFEIVPLIDWHPEVCQKVDWSSSALDNYYGINYTEYMDKIAESKWNIETFNLSSYNIKTVFSNEITNEHVYLGKIGIMYVSDYGYASLPDYWLESLSTNDNDRNINNWLYTELVEWTISKRGDCEANLIHKGIIGATQIVDSIVYYSRPTFYLKPDVLYISGTGTQEDPYRIA